MIRGHGNNLYHFKEGSIAADFSSNIAFNNQSGRILEYLQSKLSSLQNYPDPECSTLVSLLAEHHQVPADNILVTNGSAEAFYLIAHYLCKKYQQPRSCILTPSFAEYEDSCRLHEHQLHFSPISDFATLDLKGIDSLWLGCPNNPDGTRIAPEAIRAQGQAHPHCTFVLDCAYHELSQAVDISHARGDNHIHIHSLTKSFGIPGLRLGYILTTAPTIAYLQDMRPPWCVNALSLEAGCYILRHYKDLLFPHGELMAESQFLQKELSRLPALHITPSTCNFFLCRLVDGRKAEELQNYLIQKHALLVRHAGNFRGLDETCFRIAAQSRPHNLQLIHALKEWSSLPH